MIPACEATGPDGARVVIHPHAETDSVADLARALDLPCSAMLAIDGRPVAPHDRLVAAGLRVGSIITASPSSPSPSPSSPSSPSPSSMPEPLPQPSSGAGSSVIGAGIAVAVVVGPACERWQTLAAGRHTVGRAATADIRVDDAAVELHHGVLDVAADGSVSFTQLTGSFPATVDGVPCRSAEMIEPGCALSIGTSRLVFARRNGTAGSRSTATGTTVPADRDPWRSIVRRGPLTQVATPPVAIELPEPPAPHRAPPLTTLVGAGIAAVGAALLAVVVGQVLFAVFAAVGAVASLATWAVGALVARRDRRRSEARHRSQLADFEQALVHAHAAADGEHRMRHRSVVDALELIHGDGSGLWSHRCRGTEALWATLGRGTCRWALPIASDDRRRLDPTVLVTLDRCERLDDVAVPLALEPGSIVAFRGSPAMGEALCRSVIVQLASTYGPADWELQLVTDRPEHWKWVSWLPQARHRCCVVAASDSGALVAAMETASGDADHGRRTVVVLDAPALLSARTGPLRRRLERGDVACITLIAPDAAVPAVVDRILELGDTGAAGWSETTASVRTAAAAATPVWTRADRELLVGGLSSRSAEAAARRLAPLIDPEDHDGSGATPTEVSLARLEPADGNAATTIARRWMNAGRDPAPIATLGMSADGLVDIDLVRDGPHGLVAGTTGSGKSELLRTLVVSLAARTGPDHVTMILVDFKGGSTFDACARLPHTVGVVTDLDDGLAARMLVSLDAEVRRREVLLRAAGVDDLAGYRRAVDDALPRLVVVIDEFASLARELPDFLGALVAIAQRGRSLGIHLLLATQRPAGVVTDDIRANTNLRIALRLQDRTDADDVVGDAAPAGFPVGVPGRAALRLGPDELVVFQTATTAGPLPQRSGRLRVERWNGDSPTQTAGRSSSSDAAPDLTATTSVLDHLVDAICQAAVIVGSARPHRPWIDALTDVVRPGDLTEPGAVGVLDDPAHQCRRPLTWRPATGNLLLVGAIGAGTTTAAQVVAEACVREADVAATHLYVVDALGDAAWTRFEALAHCGAVVRVGELERLTRLLARLAGELDRRTSGDDEASGRPVTVVVIDGFAAVRDALGDVAHGESARRLDRLLRDGPAVGLVAVVTTDGVSSAGLAVPRAATWLFHVGDAGVARAAGLRAPAVKAGVPGRLRVAESGLEGQVVFDPDPLHRSPPDGAGNVAGGPAPIEVLPAFVDADELDSRCASDPVIGRPAERPLELLIGLGADDIEPAVLKVPVGDHVFIGGGARTGRSTALRRIEAAWLRLHPDGRVVRVERTIGCTLQDLQNLQALQDLQSSDTGGVGETPVLVVVDDADRVDDSDGVLAGLVAQRQVTFAVAARPDAVRVAYGHWTRDVARSRCGLIMTSMGDVDGELLGATLPRRPAIPPRPGLAWVIDQDGHRLAQVAARMFP